MTTPISNSVTLRLSNAKIDDRQIIIGLENDPTHGEVITIKPKGYRTGWMISVSDLASRCELVGRNPQKWTKFKCGSNQTETA